MIDGANAVASPTERNELSTLIVLLEFLFDYTAEQVVVIVMSR
jgi:hypothetical protein